MTSDLQRHLRRVALTLGIAAAYVVVRHVGGALFEFTEIRVTLIWPPSGLAVGALLIGGPAVLPGLALGVLAANLTVGNPLTFGLVTALGNTLEAIVAAWMLRRLRFQRSFDSAADVWKLVSSAAAAAPVAATTGVHDVLCDWRRAMDVVRNAVGRVVCRRQPRHHPRDPGGAGAWRLPDLAAVRAGHGRSTWLPWDS